jgi:hypothetical protein
VRPGETLEFTIAGLDLTSLGAPQNTTATVAIDGVSRGTATVTGGTAEISVTLPAGTTAGEHVATVTAAPSGTTVRVPFTVASGTLTAPTPTISGTAKVGQKLTAVTGTWGPAPVSLRYQWLRDGSAIAGATKSTYTLTAADGGDRVSVRVTGTKTGYTTASRTSASKVVAPGTLTAKTVTFSGPAKVGQKLTAKTGTWGPAPVKLSYQWLRDGKAIKGATKSTHTLTAGDRGHRISVRITGTKTGYTTTSKTSSSKVVAVGTLTVKKPTISGPAQVGRTLSVKIGKGSPSGIRYSYQWIRDGKAIKGATGVRYTLEAADRGSRIAVKVTGAKAGYASKSAVSSATQRVR